MTPKQFRLILFLLAVLIIGQQVQTALLLRAARQNRIAIESADASAIDALEVAKEVRAQQAASDTAEPDAGLLLVSTPK